MARGGKRSPVTKPPRGKRRGAPELRESLEQFRLAQEALGIVTWIWDVPTDRAQWYGDAAALLGLKPGSFSGRFEDYLACVHPDDRARARAVYLDCFKGRTPEYRSEDRVVWPDGRVQWLETYGRASYGRDGRTVRMTGVIKNITPRKRQEADLRRAESMFSALFSSNPEAIIITRLSDARILEVNPAWERNSGFTRAEVIGRGAGELRFWVEPEDRDSAVLLLERRGAFSNIETRFRRGDGRLIEALVSASRIVVDGEACGIWCWRDITEAREAERRAHESERKYAALYEVNPEPVLISRVRDAAVLEVNAAFERASGFRRGDVIGRSLRDLRMWRNMDRRQEIVDRLRRDGEVRNFEMQLLRPDGSVREVLMSAKRVELDGELCILWTSHDLTEVRAAWRRAQQSEHKFLALFEHSPEPISLMRISDGMRLAANAAWERYTGYPRDRASGQPATKMSLFRDPAVRAALIERVAAEGSISNVEARLVRPDGTERDALISAVTLDVEGERCILWCWRDVTAERDAQRLASQSLEKFATLFRTNPVGIVIAQAGEDEVITEINDAALRILGVTRTEALGTAASNLVRWIDRESREALRARVRAGEYVIDAAQQFQRRDGTIVEALFSGGLVRLDGRPHLVVSFRDATEQLRSERARQLSDARYRALFESAVDGMYIARPGGPLLDANPAFCRLLGYAREELIGRNAASLFDPEELRRLPIRTDLAERWGRVERRVPRKGGGEPVAVEIVAGPMPDGNILAILRDITERKRSETLLMNVARGVSAEVGEAFFRSLVEHLARELEADFAFIGELDASARVRTLAYLSDGAIAPNFEYPLETSPSANAVAQRGTVVYDKGVADLFPLNPGLRERGVQGYVASALFGASGEPLGVLVVMSRRPIERAAIWASMIEIFGARAAAELERARADLLVRQMNASLEQRVRERTQELEEANRDLDSYNFSVSHDLRQPLNAIAGFSELLRENLVGGAAGEALEYTREIETNATRMEQMIEALLSFSRAGRGALQSAQVDMRALVDSVLRDLGVAAPLRAEVVVGELPPVPGDATLLRQVWSNLIGNALKYSARTEAPRIEIAGVRRGGAIEYSVRDNGVGFDMRHAERLFGVFQRLPSSAGFEGTGVGLAIVQRIVRRHGGQISGESAPGQGTTLRFSLPA